MNVKYLIPFVEAAVEVLEAEAKCHFKRGELALDKGAYITDELTVIISLIGDVGGTVFYSLNTESALWIVSGMLGEKVAQLDSLAQSGIAELGNVITGKASVKLSQTGYECTISPPTLLLGKNARISTLDYPRLVVPLIGEAGTMMIHLAMREVASKGANAAQLKVPTAPKVE